MQLKSVKPPTPALFQMLISLWLLSPRSQSTCVCMPVCVCVCMCVFSIFNSVLRVNLDASLPPFFFLLSSRSSGPSLGFLFPFFFYFLEGARSHTAISTPRLSVISSSSIPAAAQVKQKLQHHQAALSLMC